ncbi:MAG: GNAT family N-acetyltransferase [Nitrospiraceae bacterium]
MSALNQLIIRQACTQDLEVLVRFNAAMALETEGKRLDPNRLQQGTLAVFESPSRGFYLVAELSAETTRTIVGQLLVTYEWSDWRNANFWWIQSVYVHPEWRRQGIYRRMHAAVLDEARTQGGICGIRLYVEGSNTIAQAAYARVGLSTSTYRVFEDDFVLPRARGHAETPRE